MSNINQDSLVFAIPINEGTVDEEFVTCQIPIEMVMSWMTAVHPHADKYKSLISHYADLANKHGIIDDEEIKDFSYNNGMHDDMQQLMMDVIMDLRETMDINDFLDLWKLTPDGEDDEYMLSNSWVGRDKDGEVFRANIEDTDINPPSPTKH